MLIVIGSGYRQSRKSVAINRIFSWVLDGYEKNTDSSIRPKFILKVLLLVLLTVIVALDPFGLGDGSDKKSNEIFYHVYSPFYPTTGREKITVVLIDDETVASGQMQWPPLFSQYEQLLNNISYMQPSSIFLDALLMDKRGEAEDLEYFSEFLKNSRSGNTPIFFMQNNTLYADDEECARESVKILPQISESVTDTAFSNFEGFGGSYPIVGRSRCSRELLKSPALLLYESACKSGAISNCLENIKDTENYHVLEDPMSIVWGNGTSNLNKRLHPDSYKNNTNGNSQNLCSSDAFGFWNKTVKSLGYFFGGVFTNASEINNLIFGQDEISKSDRCFYHTNVSAIDVLSMSDEKLLKEAFSNKIVLVGINLSGINDHINSPVQGLVPGVMGHAMALDNIISFGENYIRPPMSTVGALDADALIEMAYIIVIEIIIMLAIWQSKLRVSEIKRSLKYIESIDKAHIWLLLYLLIAILLVILFVSINAFLIWVSFSQLNFDPVNWIGLSTISAAFLFTIREEADGLINLTIGRIIEKFNGDPIPDNKQE